MKRGRYSKQTNRSDVVPCEYAITTPRADQLNVTMEISQTDIQDQHLLCCISDRIHRG